MFKDYFTQVFGVDGSGKSDEAILAEGLQALFSFYRSFGFPTSFAEIKERKESLNELRAAIALVGAQPSIYTTFTVEKIEQMMLESIDGYGKKGGQA